MPFLVKCRALFDEGSLPIATTGVGSRPLVQTQFHRHEFFEMIFVARGTLLNRLPAEKILLKPGDLLIPKPIAPHRPHRPAGRTTGRRVMRQISPPPAVRERLWAGLPQR